MNEVTKSKAEASLIEMQIDAINDCWVAPLSRIAGLRSQVNGIQTFTTWLPLAKDHDRQKSFDAVLEYFKEAYPNCTTGSYMELNVAGQKSFNITATQLQGSGAPYVLAYLNYSDTGIMNDGEIAINYFDSKVLEGIQKTLLPFMPIKEAPRIVHLTITSDQKILRAPATVTPEMTKLHEEFYPYVEGGIGNLLSEYYDSKSSILILTGIKGTGKSSLTRSLVNYSSGYFYMLDDSTIYTDTHRLNTLLSHLRNMALKKEVTVILEEVDDHVRSKSYENSFLPRLLSISSGVLNVNIKFVILANLQSLNQFDENLTRPGRTFAAIVGQKLTPNQANAARAKLNKNPLPFSDDVTLAFALNTTSNRLMEYEKQIGFIKK